MKSDIELAHEAKIKPITEIAKKIGLTEDDLEQYGPYKAKVKLGTLKRLLDKKERGKLILVTAMTPTKFGEGKSTVSIGLADALNLIGKRCIVALREPSLGPCFGVKGGACGGGMSQIIPMEDINLHFTGDIHAITASNNLISALIDNHIQKGNELGLDPRTITWNRCLDLNDRELRNCIVGLGGAFNGVPREEHFKISVASEIMAIVCLSRTISELKDRLGKITIGKTFDGREVRFSSLNSTGAVAALLKDAIRPNLVQTLYGTPAFVHGGPFANIAHGCNSLNATLCALALGDYVVTEAGFGSDLGAEKFMDIKCRVGGLEPSCAVIVSTIRALKLHGEGDLAAGFSNLLCHIENMKKFHVPAVVAINKFYTDTEDEIAQLKRLCESVSTPAVVTQGWEFGAMGGQDLATSVLESIDCAENSSNKEKFSPLYSDSLPLKEKIEKIAKEIYRAGKVDFSSLSLKKIAAWEKDYPTLPICIAKTQNSISSDPKLLGAPKGYTLPIRDVALNSGAGFVVVLAGDIMTMPGLPKEPAALNIDVDDDGVISGLF